MKAPIVALAATAAGFAAASAYLYGELGVERVRTQAEVAARSKHEAHMRHIQTAEGPQSQASVLPFSQLEASSFVEPKPPAVSPGPNESKPQSTVSATFVREERDSAPRIERRLNRERETDAR